MKNFFKVTAMLFAVLCFGACSNDNDEFAPEFLEVTPYNISGYWKLTEYNGMAIPDGVYGYVEYTRKKERTFVIYDNFNSMYPDRKTGVYTIEKDKYGKAILDGKYDYSMGEGGWNNRYYVTELQANSMKLTADSENADVCVYVRCNEIPAEITGTVE